MTQRTGKRTERMVLAIPDERAHRFGMKRGDDHHADADVIPGVTGFISVRRHHRRHFVDIGQLMPTLCRTAQRNNGAFARIGAGNASKQMEW